MHGTVCLCTGSAVCLRGQRQLEQGLLCGYEKVKGPFKPAEMWQQTSFTCKPQKPTKHASSVAEMPSQAIWLVTIAPPATSWTTVLRDTASCSLGPDAIQQLASCSWPVSTLNTGFHGTAAT